MTLLEKVQELQAISPPLKFDELKAKVDAWKAENPTPVETEEVIEDETVENKKDTSKAMFGTKTGGFGSKQFMLDAMNNVTTDFMGNRFVKVSKEEQINNVLSNFKVGSDERTAAYFQLGLKPDDTINKELFEQIKNQDNRTEEEILEDLNKGDIYNTGMPSVDFAAIGKALGNNEQAKEAVAVTFDNLNNVESYIEELKKAEEKGEFEVKVSENPLLDDSMKVALQVIGAADNVAIGWENAYESSKAMGVDFLSPVLSKFIEEEKLDEYVIDQFKKSSKLMSERNDIGSIIKDFDEEGNFQGFTQGTELIGGVINGVGSLIETMVPAALTRGASLLPQIAAPMYIDYNITKAESIYGENPDALRKLKENGETEILIPTALGGLAMSLEYIGLKGIAKQIAGKTGKLSPFINMVFTQSGEGITEVGQLGVETFNNSIAKGLSINESLGLAFDSMSSQEAYESFALGFVSSGIVTAPSTFSQAMVTQGENAGKVEQYVNTLSQLQIERNSNKNSAFRQAKDVEINEVQNSFKDFIKNSYNLSSILDKKQQDEIVSLIDQKNKNNKNLENLTKSYNKGEMSSQQYGSAKGALVNSNKALNNKITSIQSDIQTKKEEISKAEKERANTVGMGILPTGTQEGGMDINEGEMDLTEQSAEDLIAEFEAKEKGKKLSELTQDYKEGDSKNINKLKKQYQAVGRDALQRWAGKRGVPINLSNPQVNQEVTSLLNMQFESFTRNFDPTKSEASTYMNQIAKRIGPKIVEEATRKGQQVSQDVLQEKGVSLETTSQKDFDSKTEEAVGKRDKRYIGSNEKVNEVVGIEARKQIENETGQAILDQVAKGKNTTGIVSAINAMFGDAKARAVKNDVVAGKWNILGDKIGSFKKGYPEFVDNVVDADFISQLPSAYIKQSGLRKILGVKKIGKSDKVVVKEDGKKSYSKPDTFLLPGEITPKMVQEVKNYFKKSNPNRLGLFQKISTEIAMEQLVELKNDDVFMGKLQDALGKDKSAVDFINDLESKMDQRTKEDTTLDVTSKIDKFIENVLEPRIKESGGVAGSGFTPGEIAKALKTALKGYQSLIKKGKPFKEALNKFINDFVNALQDTYSLTKNQIKDITSLIREKLKTALDFNQKKLKELVKDFDLKLKGKSKIDSLLTKAGLDKTLNLGELVLTKKGREKIVDTYRNVVQLLPKAAWIGPQGGHVFATSGSDYGDISMSGPIYTKGKKKGQPNPNWNKKKADALTALRQDISDMLNDPKTKFGDDIPGVDNFSVSGYSTIFKGTPAEIKEKADAFNDKIGKIHKVLWQRINKLIANDKTITPDIATYLKLVANHRGHWHKMGAQIFGYSVNPKLRYEYEHAMPATAAYQYLLDASLEGKRFNDIYNLVIDNYKLIALDKAEDNKLRKAGLQRNMPKGWNPFAGKWWQRYFNTEVAKTDGGINPGNVVDLDGNPLSEVFDINSKGETKLVELTADEKKAKNKINKLAPTITDKKQTTKEVKQTLLNSLKAKVKALNPFKKRKGLSAFDMDDTLALTKEKVIYKLDGKTAELTAGEFAVQYEGLLEQGAEFDYSNFDNVDLSTPKGPLAGTALQRQAKYGPKDIYIVTARPNASQQAIKVWTNSIGLNIPLKNIITLEDGSPQAKANWLLTKAEIGYNDFYFADDSALNVQTVKDILSQIDVKSRVQQAIVDKAARLEQEMNDLIEDASGIDAATEVTDVEAKLEGKKRDKGFLKRVLRQFKITSSADDFLGLGYKLFGFGEKGTLQQKWYIDNLIKPYDKAEQELISAKVTTANDFAAIKKAFPSLKNYGPLKNKNPLNEEIGYKSFTVSQAVRVYLWNKQGMDIPGISKTDVDNLAEAVATNFEFQQFADKLQLIQKEKEYPKPSLYWFAGDIKSDILSGLDKTFRGKLLTEWKSNIDIAFSDKNMNKLEAAFGSKYVEAIRDAITRMTSGSNRSTYEGSGSRQVNEMMDWLNSSVAVAMFLNMRSGSLQMLSNVNFINWGDNNIYAAAKAFASKDYVPTVMKLMNSDYLVNRRDGLKINVNEAELAAAANQGGFKGMLNYLLDKGFILTRIFDSLAIASGGATFYINRTKANLKRINPNTDKLYTQAEAEVAAFDDFYAIAEETQQSSNPSKISSQQASLFGRVILAFQNVTMQYNRKAKKMLLDFVNRRRRPGMTQRESDLSNLSGVVYYVAVQNLIFNSLQQALFALAFDEDDEREKDKVANTINSMMDSLLFGLGFGGAIVSTVKNVARELNFQHNRKTPKYEEAVFNLFDISPVIDQKVRNVRTALRTFSWNRKEIKSRGWSLENPAYLAISQLISAFTNVPIDRLLRKYNNINQAFDEETKTFERVALIMGWNGWNFGLPYWGRESTIQQELQDEETLKNNFKADVRKAKKDGFTKRVPFTGENSWSEGVPKNLKLGKDYVQIERYDGMIQYYKKP
jgi:hypothetical protein